FREFHLAKLLAVTHKPQTLWCEWEFNSDYSHNECNTPTFDLRIITAALLQVRDTLTELNIDAYSGGHGRPYSDVVPCHVVGAPPTALTSFDQTQTLAIPLAFLNGLTVPAKGEGFLQHCLPRSLGVLMLRENLF
ncbi:hypothetical protein QBC36DRAFT_143038, partial [Triangularia setosa]